MPTPTDKLVATEYQPFDAGQPPVHFGERTGIQSVITSPWILRWASIPATYATYREIRKHGTLALVRELKVAPVLASEWTIDADDGVPDEWKTLIEKIFFPLRDEFMSNTLYYGDVDFGYNCFEKVIEPKDGYLKIVRFKPLLHDITEICIGHKGGFIGVRQLGRDLGLANSIHVGFRVEGSYLYGIPLLENARNTYNMWVECNEGARRYDRKIAGAHIVVEYPPGSSTDRNGTEVENSVLARQVLDGLEAAGGVAVPRDMAAFMQQLNLESPGWKIWILDAGSNQQTTFVARLEYLDKLLCRSLHIPERAILEGRHGTLAEAEAHSDVVFTIQDIEHRRVTAELNRQAVNQMLVLNFGKQAKDKVRLKASPIVDEKKEFFKQIYLQILGSAAGQQELQSLDAASLREQLGLPQVQNDPGDVENQGANQGANLQAFRGLPQPPPGGAGQKMLTRGENGQPVTVDGDQQNPAAALANAVWGMREAIALSSTALKKAEALHLADEMGDQDLDASQEPAALANGRGRQPLWPTAKWKDVHQNFIYDHARKAAMLSPDDKIYDVSQIGSDAYHQDLINRNPEVFGLQREQPGRARPDVDDAIKAGSIHVHHPLDYGGIPDISVDEEKRSPDDISRLISSGKLPDAQHYNLNWGRGDDKHAFHVPQDKIHDALEWSQLVPRSELASFYSDNEGSEEGEPLELAGDEHVEQEPWRGAPGFEHGALGLMRKHVPLGENDYLNFESFINRDADAQDPEQEQVRREHDLDHPHEVLWSRASHPAPAGDGRFEVTGQGKAGPMLSHATHALRELVDEHRPVSIEFSAKEPSRIKAYHHMMRRMAKEQTGGGEYEFLHESGHSFRARNGVMIHEPAYFHIVHKAAADLPRYLGMERITSGEPVAMGGTMSDVLGARQVGGRLAEDMGGVAMDNEEENEPHIPEDSGHYGAPGEGGEPMPEIGSPEHIAQIEKYLSYERHPVRGIPSFMKRRKLADLATPEVPYAKLKEIMDGHHAKEKQAVAELEELLGTGRKGKRARSVEAKAPTSYDYAAQHRRLGTARTPKGLPVGGGRKPKDLPAGFSNYDDPQRKSIAPAIDAPEYESLSPGMQILQQLRAKRQGGQQGGIEQGYRNMSPGQRILFELRATQHESRGYGFANDPPEGGDAGKLTPNQTLDVHTLAQKLAANGNEASINMIVPSGKWREQPPHGENSEHKTRLAEAVSNAVNSGAIQKHPDKTKMGRALYIPGDKFEHFRAPMPNAPPSKRGGSHGGGGRWLEVTEPPSPESAKFIEQAALHPRQLGDLQTLVRMIQGRGGRLGAGAIDEMRGRWRSQPPHVPESGYAHRHAEALGVALKHGVIQKDNPELHQIGKVPYIAGPNYQHFLAPGETAVTPPAIAAIERRGHGLGGVYTPTGWEDYDPFADLGLELPEDKWPKFPGKQKELNHARFAKAIAKADAPEGFEYHPKDIRDMVALMDSIENGHYGEHPRAIAPNRLRHSRKTARWIDDPRDPRSEAETHYDDIIKKLAQSGAIHEARSRIPGRVAAYAPKAGEVYDYLHGLAAASIGPRVAQVKEPAGERLTKQQAWHKEIVNTANSITGLLKGTAAEKAQQESDPQAQREWQKALSQDFGQDIRERLHNERKTRGADLADKITRTGNLLHEAMKNYNPTIDGGFDQWYSRAHDDAARLADHEIRSETEPVAGFKGRSLGTPVKTKGGDEGGTLESMTGGNVKTNIAALQEPKGEMEVVRRRAARHLDHFIRDTSPKTRDGRVVLEGLNVEVAQKMGTGAWLYLKRMLHGVDPVEAKAKWMAGNHSTVAESRFEKMRNRIIEMARNRFSASDPSQKISKLHDLMEVLLDTPENIEKPVTAANRPPQEALSPGHLILSNLRQQRAAREGGIAL